MKRIYRLVDRNENILFEGTYEECVAREQDKLVYVGISTPIYHATSNDGVDITGTVRSIAQSLGMPYINLYNYTRYRRRSDGLFLEKVRDEIV